MSLVLLSHYLLLNLFRMLVHPSSGACDLLCVDLFHVLYCSGSMCVGLTVWFGWIGVVSLCRLKHYLLLNMYSIYMDTTYHESSRILKYSGQFCDRFQKHHRLLGNILFIFKSSWKRWGSWVVLRWELQGMRSREAGKCTSKFNCSG